MAQSTPTDTARRGAQRPYAELAMLLALAPIAVVLTAGVGSLLTIPPEAASAPAAIVAIGFPLIRKLGWSRLFILFLLGTAWLATFRAALVVGGAVPTPLGMLVLIFAALAFSALAEIGVNTLVRVGPRSGYVWFWSTYATICVAVGMAYVYDRRDDYAIARHLPYALLSDFHKMNRLITDAAAWESTDEWMADFGQSLAERVGSRELLEPLVMGLIRHRSQNTWPGIQVLLHHGADIHRPANYIIGDGPMSIVEFAVEEGAADMLAQLLAIDAQALERYTPGLLPRLCSRKSFETLALLLQHGSAIDDRSTGSQSLIDCVVQTSNAQGWPELFDVALDRPLVIPAHYSAYSQDAERQSRADLEARLARWRAEGPVVLSKIIERDNPDGTRTVGPLFDIYAQEYLFVMHLVDLGARCSPEVTTTGALGQFCRDYASKLE